MTRQEMIAHFSKREESQRILWGIGISTSDQLASAQQAGAAWVVASHAGGLDPEVPASAIGLLPFADANTEVLELGIIASKAAIPVFAGIFAVDQFRIMRKFLEDLKDAGYGAVQNFPSVGLAEGKFKCFLTEANLGYELEVEALGLAHQLGFFVSALVFTPQNAEAMLKAGADMLVFHPGLNADGEYRPWNATAKQRFAEIAAAAKGRRTAAILARLAFDQDDSSVAEEGSRVGVQYDKNIG